jgi:hypothetical protein
MNSTFYGDPKITVAPHPQEALHSIAIEMNHPTEKAG